MRSRTELVIKNLNQTEDLREKKLMNITIYVHIYIYSDHRHYVDQQLENKPSCLALVSFLILILGMLFSM